jgi:hypothetical protein
MSWENNRPIYHKLPAASGDFQGNEIVDHLTSYWDNLLVSTKQMIDNPDQWLGSSPNTYFLDWVAIGLCGFGVFWDPDLPDPIKVQLIRSYDRIRNRTNRISNDLLVDLICSGARLVRISIARAGVSRTGLSNTYFPRDNRYWIRVPHEYERSGLIWRMLERLITDWFPIGNGRVQYGPTATGFTVIGDSILQESSTL